MDHHERRRIERRIAKLERLAINHAATDAEARTARAQADALRAELDAALAASLAAERSTPPAPPPPLRRRAAPSPRVLAVVAALLLVAVAVVGLAAYLRLRPSGERSRARRTAGVDDAVLAPAPDLRPSPVPSPITISGRDAPPVPPLESTAPARRSQPRTSKPTARTRAESRPGDVPAPSPRSAARNANASPTLDAVRTRVADWRQLKRDDGPAEVRLRLGEPDHVQDYGPITTWVYQAGGNASFCGSPARLCSWSEPTIFLEQSLQVADHGPALDLRNWRRVTRNAPRDELRNRLGEPDHIRDYGPFVVWTYPFGGTVELSGTPVRITAWNEPSAAAVRVGRPVSEDRSTDVRLWRRLERGQTQDAVRDLLGEPDHIQDFGPFVTWSYFRGGTASFAGATSVLSSWSEPSAPQGRSDGSAENGSAHDPDAWSRLRKGATPAEVRTMLGEPDHVRNFGPIVLWTYGKRGAVSFGNGDGTVSSWSAQ